MGRSTVRHHIGYRKTGQTSLFNRKFLATFRGKENLPRLCIELLSRQKKAWKDLREGYELLAQVKERDLSCRGFSVRLQYNPGRIKSSTAAVDKKNEKERRCFLCLDHLPEDQKGILYRKDYLILCNPMPVFPYHFTVSHVNHRLQSISENIESFLQLMTDFGSGWVVLYNGPKCGASAPDHLHFQIAPSGQMPIENEIQEEKRLTLMRKMDGVLIYRMKNLGREATILSGDDPKSLETVLKNYLDSMKQVLLTEEEPMVNIAGFQEKRKWLLVIFPRRKHRPAAFFKEGKARKVVSPGAIDMGGLLITPVEKDFERLTDTAVKGIYREVSLGKKSVEKTVEAMG